MQKLNEIIKSLDGRPVSSYSKLKGAYERNGVTYVISSVTGGQYRCASVDVKFDRSGFIDDEVLDDDSQIAVCSHILTEFSVSAYMANNEMQQSESNIQKGVFIPYCFGTRVLPSSAVKISERDITVRLNIRLPYNNTAYNNGVRATEFTKAESGSVLAMTKSAQRESLGKRKNGVISSKALKLLLTKNLPSLAESFEKSFDKERLKRAIQLYKNQQYIREFLKKQGYVSFIANGSVITRKGKTDYKDINGSIPFVSPESLRLIIKLPDGNFICGMGIKNGITLITGDAYHGKSTVLEAIREGVYNHIEGDGREYVITDKSAVAVHSEDGRSIRNTDISFFLSNLPTDKINPKSFSTDNASGSTSQASAVIEAIESGSSLMLFDEDRCANNFMYKDEKMRSVIKNASTVPFIDNARMFYNQFGISSVIVIGASGEYFRIADTVLLVDKYVLYDYSNFTKENKKSASFCPKPRLVDISELREYCIRRNMEIKDGSVIRIGPDEIKTDEIIPHLTRGQLDFICSFIYFLAVMECNAKCELKTAIDRLYSKIHTQGVDFIHQSRLNGSTEIIEYVRPEDIMAILFRMRSVKFTDKR
ncbi:MAG: hypothetical protein IKC74_03450 [Clostridia bacterium]|nr:hypothetical protein [Clostridia bacterium]